MQHEASLTAVVIFGLFVAGTLILSWWLGKRTKGASGYFAAHGQIPWFVNGVAFAGDYLSAASFLGICGMIAFYGYDGFLYSIGFLAGWVVALFVIAEPMKRLGKFTFADALDAKFNSKGIKIAAGLSTLAVSVFYLIPQMVGAGALVTPLLGLPHWAGVALVGGVVIAIVTTAGMVSTTWVQFIKGGLLVVFSTILVGCVLWRGFEPVTLEGVPSVGEPAPTLSESFRKSLPPGWEAVGPEDGWSGDASRSTEKDRTYYVARNVEDGQAKAYWQSSQFSDAYDPARGGAFVEVNSLTTYADGTTSMGGQPASDLNKTEAPPLILGRVAGGTVFLGSTDGEAVTEGALGPLEFLREFNDAEIISPTATKILDWGNGNRTIIAQRYVVDGKDLLTPGNHPKFADIKSDELLGKINFLSLMLALFCGTASLPHILIRYYTVKDAAAARKSTIVGIIVIGFFYVLTLFIGLGAMTSGALDPTDSNMAAPLLARAFGEWLFACISAVAFTTVLGTVSGLILASAGAVSHDLMTHGLGIELDENQQVRVAKIASVGVGLIAIGLGIAFQGMNVSYLVGWAFSVAASANLPALVCILFWKGTTARGVIAGVTVGMLSSLAWILLSSDTFEKVYGLDPSRALTPFTQPGLVTIPLGFLTLIVVSLLTRRRAAFAVPE
ncbi:solute symporter family protein [Alienimonas chondri]|uniref:Cation/acetate symporter ActP n=1 Tax=Alienimonas chondri TaxID=2681879 RepID=A0ABX1VDV1_9PLAN|nr:cation acetate symporter [Alienimonas chondri]NNJ26234.1 Cation/acetate symporter ActP [Alienimonas chondri]